jgi:hypothetical protein
MAQNHTKSLELNKNYRKKETYLVIGGIIESVFYETVLWQ